MHRLTKYSLCAFGSFWFMLQMQKVVAGLEHMHAHGLIHRDIKVQKWKDFMRHQMHRFKKTPRRDLFDHIYD